MLLLIITFLTEFLRKIDRRMQMLPMFEDYCLGDVWKTEKLFITEFKFELIIPIKIYIIFYAGKDICTY